MSASRPSSAWQGGTGDGRSVADRMRHGGAHATGRGAEDSGSFGSRRGAEDAEGGVTFVARVSLAIVRAARFGARWTRCSSTCSGGRTGGIGEAPPRSLRLCANPFSSRRRATTIRSGDAGGRGQQKSDSREGAKTRRCSGWLCGSSFPPAAATAAAQTVKLPRAHHLGGFAASRETLFSSGSAAP